MDVSRFKISKTYDAGLRNGQAPSKLNGDSGEFSYVFFFLFTWARLWSVAHYDKVIIYSIGFGMTAEFDWLPRIYLMKSLLYWQTSYSKVSVIK